MRHRLLFGYRNSEHMAIHCLSIFWGPDGRLGLIRECVSNER